MNEINRACTRIIQLKLIEQSELVDIYKEKQWELPAFLDALEDKGILDKAGPDGARIPNGLRDEIYAYAKSWPLFVYSPAVEISTEVRESFAASMVRQVRAVPVKLQDNRLICVCDNPSDQQRRRQVQSLTPRAVELIYASNQTIDLLIEQFYSTQHEASKQGALASKEFASDQGSSSVHQDESAVQQALSAIIEGALQQGEADIHIEPFKDHLEVRYGKGSNLRPQTKFPLSLATRLAGVIRAKAKIKEPEFQCQNGTLTHVYNNVEYSLRVGILPSVYGSSITLRLGQDRAWSLDEIGMNPTTLEKWKSVVENKNGLYITTGPMGSGKTILLQATLQNRAGANRKIVTLEAPIEYRFPKYVTQVQIDKGRNLDWNQVIPTVLRSAASTILLGEINEAGIGKTAVDAANTGHQVFSTLHTNDAVTSITRLREFGIMPSVLSDVMRAVCAQRLVDTLCQHCKIPALPSQRHLDLFQAPDEMIANATWFDKNPAGCEHCAHTGISGRAPIHELLTFDEAVRDLVAEAAPSKEIRKAAIDNGMVLLQDSALAMAAEGRTSLALAREEITF